MPSAPPGILSKLSSFATLKIQKPPIEGGVVIYPHAVAYFCVGTLWASLFLYVYPRSDKRAYWWLIQCFTTKCEGFSPTSLKGVRKATPGTCRFLLSYVCAQGKAWHKTNCGKNWRYADYFLNLGEVEMICETMFALTLIVRAIKDNVKDNCGDNCACIGQSL